MSLLLGSGLSGGFSCAMNLINYDEFRAMLEEIGAVTVRLGVINAGDDVGEISEYALVTGWQLSFELAYRAGADNHWVDMEFLSHLPLPLVAEIGRTKDADALNLTPVQKFTSDEQAFYRLADSHIVGD